MGTTLDRVSIKQLGEVMNSKSSNECIACKYSGSDEAEYQAHGCPACTCLKSEKHPENLTQTSSPRKYLITEEDHGHVVPAEKVEDWMLKSWERAVVVVELPGAQLKEPSSSTKAFQECISGRFEHLNEESLLFVAKDPSKRHLVEDLILDQSHCPLVRKLALNALTEARYLEGLKLSPEEPLVTKLLHDLTQSGYEVQITDDFNGMLTVTYLKTLSEGRKYIRHEHLSYPDSKMSELNQKLIQSLGDLLEEIKAGKHDD